MFALGAAACTRLPRLLVAFWAVLVAANGAFSLPLVLPVLAPDRLEQMLDRMSSRPPPIEAAGIGAPLMQMLSDEFGWRELARDVEAAYAALPPADRARAAIFASNYGEAAAIDVYGTGLPPALSGNNQYYLWGPRGTTARSCSPSTSTRRSGRRFATRHKSSRTSAPRRTRCRTSAIARSCSAAACTRRCRSSGRRFKHYGIENLGSRTP